MRPSPYQALLLFVCIAGGVGVWAISGQDEDPPSGSVQAPVANPVPTPPTAPVGAGQSSEQPGSSAEPPSSKSEREVARTVRRYVDAISERDGATVCDLVPSVIDLQLPERGTSCAESLSASIGYRDPRGFPVFDKAVLTGEPGVELNGAEARATATIVTDFADRDEPSVEDDVIYLEREDRGWVIAKPSSTLYRAIGTPDVPPDVLTPPE